MKKNIFFVVLAFFSITLLLDAAKKNDDKNITLICPSSSSSSSSSSASSSLQGDEKIVIVSGFSVYRDLERNDLKEVKETIAAMLWDAAESKNYKLIMGVKDVVDGLDQKNVHALIDPASFYQYVLKAFIEKQDGFFKRLLDITITGEEESGFFYVDKCSKSLDNCRAGTIAVHAHTVFHYKLQNGKLIFRRKTQERSDGSVECIIS